MDTLLELAERCEQATGPDAEADYHIHALVMGWRIPDELHCFSWCVGDNYQFGHPDDFNRAIYISESELPNYTASLDAAMSLVPGGAGINLERFWVREGERWSCILAQGLSRNNEYVQQAASGPLALCAAALRAQAANPRRKEG